MFPACCPPALLTSNPFCKKKIDGLYHIRRIRLAELSDSRPPSGRDSMIEQSCKSYRIWNFGLRTSCVKELPHPGSGTNYVNCPDAVTFCPIFLSVLIVSGKSLINGLAIHPPCHVSRISRYSVPIPKAPSAPGLAGGQYGAILEPALLDHFPSRQAKEIR